MIHEDMSEADPEVHEALEKESERQESEALEMIASENFVPRQVLQAQGSLMTNKYAEGLPGKRYYAGCEHHDTVENLARQRACDLFGADHANVQPHSGSTANFAAYFALLDQGDRVLGPSLDDGGHLTHGHPVNFSGELFDFGFYTLDSEDGRFRREDVLEAARQHDPELIVTGFSAYPREFDFEMFAEVADEVDAYLMADVAHISGLVAADVHQQPFPHCDVVTTTTHKSIRGARGGMILCQDEHADAIDKSVFPFAQGGPLMHQVAAKAVSFKEAQKPRFKDYAHQIRGNAEVLAEDLRGQGFDLVSGGTDTHLVLVDLRDTDLTGKQAEKRLEENGVVSNKNAVPDDPEPPQVTSGIRLGTPALTTRGMGEAEMREIADLIGDVLLQEEDRSDAVEQLLQEFPLYRDSEVDY